MGGGGEALAAGWRKLEEGELLDAAKDGAGVSVGHLSNREFQGGLLRHLAVLLGKGGTGGGVVAEGSQARGDGADLAHRSGGASYSLAGLPVVNINQHTQAIFRLTKEGDTVAEGGAEELALGGREVDVGEDDVLGVDAGGEEDVLAG